MASAIEQLLHSPRLPLYLRQLQAALDDEQRLRQHFYDSITEEQRAEFINGEIIVGSPVSLEHTSAAKSLLGLLDAFAEYHGLGYVGHGTMLISLTRNDYEPDICFFGVAKAAQFEPQQMPFPAPDLVVEVLAPSTAERDRGVQFEDYAAHGVAEYWLIDPATQTIEQYLLQGESYELLTKARSGTVASAAVPGFEIPIRAIFDRAENLAALQGLLAGRAAP